MKIGVAVLTYNRKALFINTLDSLLANRMYETGSSFSLSVYDNGSHDGTDKLVREIGGQVNTGDNHTTGFGMNRVIEMAMKTKPDVILFTADDFFYRSDWLEKLVAFWEAAPTDVVLASCYLEPDWDWNKISEIGDAGGQHYAIRASVPGSNWSFRTSDLYRIYPVAEKTGGEDLEICHRLTSQGAKLVALDLVKHTGERQSAWGNGSWQYAKSLDLAALGFAEWSEHDS